MQDACIICLDTANVTSSVLPCRCKLHIHSACYNRWKESNGNTCPLCRNRLVTRQPIQVVPAARVTELTFRQKVLFCVGIVIAIVVIAFMMA